jgi:dihydroneopterin aldolase/2-amino-4-hydroxy-6-hydroxymethyldihydropteridine diphosphokinase
MVRPVSDRIDITGLRVTTIVGALPHEREIAQPLQIDLSLEVDLTDAGISDELGDTVNYGAVADEVAALVSERKDVLLERLAAAIAETVLSFDRVDAVDVVLTKLRPPIAVDATATAVRIRRSRADLDQRDDRHHVAHVALGSNLGDREGFLRLAVRGLGDIAAMSDVFETSPVGGPADQGEYLNMVVELHTTLDPFALLRRCQRIEAEALRQRITHWGPRTLDVDILFYDDVVIDSPTLVVPHPRLGERRFVLEPLADIAPDKCPDGWDSTLPPGGIERRGPLDVDTAP